MTSKLNVGVIFREHLETFKDEGTGQYSLLDFLVMGGVPIVLACVAAFAGFHIDDSYVGTLISAFAIFSGLLFNVLVLIYSVKGLPVIANEMRNRLISQTFANVSYSVMSCLVAVVLLTILLFVQGSVQTSVEIVIYFIGMNFVLTMLMVLKRMHVLMGEGAELNG